jgi:ubiquinone/menaquinone biosynthesis C-methylase UbiE
MIGSNDPHPAESMGGPMAGNENVNAQYFDDWKDYQQLVESIDTYALTTRALVGELCGRVVDVGSGGVVNYGCDEITELILVDISTDYPSHVTLPAHAVLKTGSAVALPLTNGAHDCLLMQMLVHHLAEQDYPTTRARCETAFREAHRVLKPGGKIVVIESTVHRFFELAQQMSFGLTRRLLGLIEHPMVLQWTQTRLCAFARTAGFTDIRPTRIPRGRWMIFLGRRWPTLLVPIGMCKLVATKPGGASRPSSGFPRSGI